MKRFVAVMLAAILVLCISLAAFAEDTNSNTNYPPQMGGEAPEGMPPKCRRADSPAAPAAHLLKNPMDSLAAPEVLPVMRLAGSRATWKGSSDPGRWAAPMRTALKAMTMHMTPRCM